MKGIEALSVESEVCIAFRFEINCEKADNELGIFLKN